MSVYDKLDRNVALSKNFNVKGYEIDNNLEKRLKKESEAKVRAVLYQDGYSWYKKGKTLDEMVDMIDSNSPKKDNINFQRGFQSAANQDGFDYGFKEIPLTEISESLINNKYFLDGYKRGIEEKKKELSRASKTK